MVFKEFIYKCIGLTNKISLQIIHLALEKLYEQNRNLAREKAFCAWTCLGSSVEDLLASNSSGT